MRIVVVQQCEPSRWVNGGGETRELASVPAPAGARSPAFDWRLSLAGIDRDGPFSPLPGVQRVFALVEGATRLAFDGAATLELDTRADPLAFDGADAPRASPRPGARCRALNLMLARGRCSGTMRRVHLAPGAALVVDRAPGFDRLACFVVAGRLAVGGGTIDADTLVELHPDDPAPLALDVAHLLVVEIGREAGPATGCETRTSDDGLRP
jgi:environmental stress-induced protein Ves